MREREASVVPRLSHIAVMTVTTAPRAMLVAVAQQVLLELPGSPVAPNSEHYPVMTSFAS